MPDLVRSTAMRVVLWCFELAREGGALGHCLVSYGSWRNFAPACGLF